MKKFVLILLTSSLIQLINGQDSKIQIDYDYFLLGTLSDYMGRSKYNEINGRIDEYSKYEESLVSILDSLFRWQYKDLEIIITKDTNRYYINSELLAKKIDDFYSYNASGTMTMDYDTIYRGSLKKEMLKTDIQKFSFILGAYIRFGVKNDSILCMRFHNSISKAHLCYDLLEDIQCRFIDYKVFSGIPGSQVVYFSPSIELKRYLDKFLYLREKLNDDWIKQIKKMIGEDNYNKYYR